MNPARITAFKKAFHEANEGEHKGDYDACIQAGLEAADQYRTPLNPGQLAVVKAALYELDLNWDRKGTANARLSEYSMNLLRGNNSPRPHESTGRDILAWLDRGLTLEFVPK